MWLKSAFQHLCSHSSRAHAKGGTKIHPFPLRMHLKYMTEWSGNQLRTMSLWQSTKNSEHELHQYTLSTLHVLHNLCCVCNTLRLIVYGMQCVYAYSLDPKPFPSYCVVIFDMTIYLREAWKILVSSCLEQITSRRICSTQFWVTNRLQYKIVYWIYGVTYAVHNSIMLHD